MRKFKRGIALYLVILAIALPWTAVQALETFEKSGTIVDIDSGQVTISAQVYRLRSSTTMISSDSSRVTVADIKVGDRVFIQGIVLNGAYYIDRLIYETPVPS